MFYEYQLDPLCSYGTQFGLNYSTLVVALPSRAEQRISQTSRGYRKAKIDFSDKTVAQMKAIRDLFMTVGGKAHGFRAKDWTDYARNYEPLPAPTLQNGSYVSQLQVVYNKLTRPETRLIRKPQENLVPLQIYRNGVLYPRTGNWSLDPPTGQVTFSANPGGVLSWSGQYDVPVRFDFDEIMLTYESFDILTWDSVNLLEIPA